MSETNIVARLALLGKAQVVAGLREVTAAAEQTTAALSKGAKTTAAAQAEQAATLKSVSTLGKYAFLGLAGAVGIVGYESVKAASQFQQAMTRVHTQAGVAQSRISGLGNGLKAMAGQVGAGPTALANALYRIASSTSGLHLTNNELLTMTRIAAQLSAVGGSDLEETARVFGGVRASGIRGGTNARNVAAWANAVVGSGDMRMNDLVDFLGTGVLPAGALAGTSLQQLGAFLALQTDNLQSGQVAGHSIAHALALLAAPTPTALQAYNAIGITATQIGDTMRQHGLLAAIGLVKQHLSAPISGTSVSSTGVSPLVTLQKYGLNPMQIQQAMRAGLTPTEQEMLLVRMFGGAKQAIPIMTAIQEYGRLQVKQADIGSKMGNWGKDVAGQYATLAQKTRDAHAAFDSLATSIGSDLIPPLSALMGFSTGVLNFFTRFKWLLGAIAVTITGVLAPAMGVYLKDKFLAADGAVSRVVKWYGDLGRRLLGLPAKFAAEEAAETTAAADNAALATSAETAGAAELTEGTDATIAAGEIKTSGLLTDLSTLGTLGLLAIPASMVALAASAPKTHVDTKTGRTYVNGKFAGYSRYGYGQHWVAPGGPDLTELTTGKPADLNYDVVGAKGGVTHVHVNIDGKQVATAVATQTRRQAARN